MTRHGRGLRSAGLLTDHSSLIKAPQMGTWCPCAHPSAAEVRTARCDVESAVTQAQEYPRSGFRSAHRRLGRSVIQALPPDARKAAVGAYEHPGAVRSLTAGAAAEAHRHAVRRLLVAAAEHTRRWLAGSAQNAVQQSTGAGRQDNTRQGHAQHAWLSLRSTRPSNKQLVSCHSCGRVPHVMWPCSSRYPAVSECERAPPGKPAVEADEVLWQNAACGTQHLPPAQPHECLAILADQALLPSSKQTRSVFLQRAVCGVPPSQCSSRLCAPPGCALS